MSTPSVTAVLITTPRRRGTTLPRALAGLAAADIFPEVVTDTATRGDKDARVRRLGLVAARIAARAGRPLLFLEDDIRVTDPALLAHQIDAAVRADRITLLCAVNAAHYPLGTFPKPAGRTVARLAPMPAPTAARGRQGGMHGSMAVMIPPRVVEAAVSHPLDLADADGQPLRQPAIRADHERGRIVGFDFWLKDVAATFGGALVAIPNPIDHMGDGPSEAWRSPTADWPWRRHDAPTD